VDQRTRIGWPDVWAVIKASAVKRLGMPLLKMYLLIAIFGLVGIVVSIVAGVLLVRPAGSSFRDVAVHGNESRA
jgi:cell division septal protein FtsQ